MDPSCEAEPPADGLSQPDDAEKQLVEAYNLSPRKLAWRRQKLREMSNPDLFDQEYPHCISADTLICTDSGIMPISEAKQAITVDGNRVSRHLPMGRKSVFVVTTKNGRTIKATADHKIGMSDGTFTEVQHLRIGDGIQLKPATFAIYNFTVTWHPVPGVTSSVLIDDDWGRFLGYFMGDGSYNGQVLSFCCDARDVDIIADISGLIVKLFGLKSRTRAVGSNGGGVEVRVSCNYLQEVFNALGILRPTFRKNGHIASFRRKVCVPECILRSPIGVVRQFLAALFECDGCSYHYQPKISFFSKYPEFMQRVNLLLSGFGVNGRITTATKRAGDGHLYTGNEMCLSARNSVVFHEGIGFISERKKSGYRYKSKPVGRVAVEILTSDEVFSVTPAGDEEVFDISVPATRSFSANGLLVHNCDEAAFLVSGRMVFDWMSLHRLQSSMQSPKWRGRLKNMGEKVGIDPNPQGPLTIWQMPREDRRYIVSADIAEGLPDGAWSVADVIDVSTWEQVAQWRGHISPTAFADVLGDLGAFYNWAIVCPEINNHGLATCARLIDEGYPKLHKRDDKRREQLETNYGWLTTRQSKVMMINQLGHAVRNLDVKVNSEATIEELKSFVHLESGDMGAQGGSFSDCVMSLAIGVALLGDMRETPQTSRQRFREAMGLKAYRVQGAATGQGGYGVRKI